MDEEVEHPHDEELAELVEQFTRESRAGHSPDVEDYARRHPELAEGIRRIFPGLECLERAAMGQAGEASPRESALPNDLICALVLAHDSR